MSRIGRFTAPFIRDNISARSLMVDVLLAFLPPLAWGVYVYGVRALVLVLVSVLGAVGSQLLWCMVTKTKFNEISSAITGVIVALLCPPSVPLWFPLVGSVFGVVVGKMLFGGIGRNIFNPAALGLAFLHVSFPEKMNTFTPVFEKLPAFAISPTLSETAESPLFALKNGMMDVSNIWEKIYGMICGNIGELSAVMLVLAWVFLFVRGTVKWEKTVSYIAGIIFFVALYCYLVAMPEPFEYAFSHLFSGSTIFVAVFLCNDYSTTPTTPNGAVFFGIVCSFFTTVFRVFCDIPDGAVFAVLVTNVLVPLLERKTRVPYFGQFFKQREVRVKADEAE